MNIAQKLGCALFFVSLNMLYSQQQQIIGPLEVCGGCHEYTVEFEATGEERYEWVVGVGDFFFDAGTSKDVLICWDQYFQNGSNPDRLNLIVTVSGGSTNGFTLEEQINIQNPTSISIIPIDAPPCHSFSDPPIDSVFCQKVCANTTITYTVDSLMSNPGGGPDGGLEWEVNGAESFEIDELRNTVKVHWGSSGFGQVSAFYYNNGCQSFATICIEIIDQPKALFTTQPPPENNELSICKGQTVFFQNNSQNAQTYEWQFGDLGNSSAVQPAFTFPAAGSYTVELLAYNECACVDTISMLVKVSEAESPSLDCVGTVCEGETINYTANQSCGQYDWRVSPNGSIVDGGGANDDFITINWLGGDIGTIELLVSDCSGITTCTEPSITQIPIISSQASIQGPPIVCESAIETYQLPSFSGTSFNWLSSNGGVIIAGQGTNAVTIDWANAGTNNPQWVAVSYENCFLGCGGSDTLDISIQPSFRVEGPIEVCQDGTAAFSAINDQNNLALPARWGIINSLGDTVWQSPVAAATPVIDWEYSPGSYRLFAIPEDPDAFCLNAVEKKVQILAPPTQVMRLLGDTLICTGQTYSYRIDSGGGFDYEWEITNGTSQTTKTGQSINVTWGTTQPYHLLITRIDRNGPGCRSVPLSVDINRLVVDEIEGPDEACVGEYIILETPFAPSISFDWRITPSGIGTFLTEPIHPSMTLFLNQGGEATVSLTACGQTITKTIEVRSLPNPDVSAPDAVCTGEIANIQAPASFSRYIWKDESGLTIGENPTIDLGPGTYSLRVSDEIGCSQDTAFTIKSLTSPNVSISTPDFTIFCNTAPQARLFALEGSQEYQYQWFRDGIPVGSNSSEFIADALGRYWVEGRTVEGCVAISNEIVLLEDCSGGGPGSGGGNFPDCPDNANPAITIIPGTNCNERTYESLSSGMVAGTANWSFDDPESGAANTSTLDQPTHVFTRAGYYRVSLIGTFSDGVDTGPCFVSTIDTVPIAAHFEAATVCVGSSVDFKDLSSFLPGEVISAWSWDFGEPGSGADNFSGEQNPSHTYATDGMYVVSLTIVSADGCQSSYSKIVEVLSAPEIALSPRSPVCEDIANSFSFSFQSFYAKAFWDFSDSSGELLAQLEGKVVQFVSDDPGNYNIFLQVEDIYGCTNTDQQVFEVLANTLGGGISSSLPSPICEGDSTLLSAPPGGISWFWHHLEELDHDEEQVWVKESGIYTLGMVDSLGCEAVSDPIVIDVIPEPGSFIRALEYDENGQVIDYHYEQFEACFGTDVVLEGNSNLPYTFSWSDGTAGPQLAFTKLSGNILNPGEYEFFLNVTDNNGQCSAQMGPFKVIIHPQPAVFSISSDQVAPICPGQNTQLSVINPDPGLTYIWNTSETTTDITANVGGNYSARAINTFGCEAQSNTIEVLPGPNVDLFPSGCHTRCNPDTICLPTLPDMTSIQWFKDGVAVPGPAGMANNLPIAESGTYWFSMEDSNGCQLETGTLELELIDGFGDIGGQVFYDVNENGVIDGADTLVSGIGIQLWLGGQLQESTASAADGGYIFEGLIGDDYSLFLDTLNLPAHMMADVVQQDTSIVDCGEMVDVNWLLSRRCITTTSTLEVNECSGNTVIYNGINFSNDTSFTQSYQDIFGCDSLEMVRIQFIPAEASILTVSVCEGETFEYQGVDIPAGSQEIFTLTAASGCDSVVTVTVTELAVLSSDLELFACIGETVSYNGQALPPGTEQTFTFTTSTGCDSLVQVKVTEFVSTSSELQLFACPGESIEYNGRFISIGDEDFFTFVNESGCDSTVLVKVAAYPELSFEVAVIPSCESEATGIAKAINISGAANPSQYTVDGQPFSSDNNWSGLQAGPHLFQIQDENDCVFEESFVIPSIPPIELGVLPGLLPCDGTAIRIGPTILSGDDGQLNFQWENGSNMPVLSVDAAGEYVVEISNSCESITQSISVIPEKSVEGDLFYVPNAFSPNEDGVNELVRVFPAPDIQLNEFAFYIFDRWGNQLFYTTDISQGWDGWLKGKLMNPGVFVWHLEATFSFCGQAYSLRRKGDVVLMR